MTSENVQTGYAAVNGAKLYYEIAGEGQPFAMIHAGVADRRQWNGEFEYFADRYRVLRFDMRSYGKSEPVEGEYTIEDDFVALLDHLEITEPLIVMGCSMGGGLAFDFALAHPERAKAIIVVGGAPAGLEIDAVEPEEKFAEFEKAFEAGDLDKATEIETQIWFDGTGRSADTVNPEMRKLAYDMGRVANVHFAKKLGKRVDKQVDTPAVKRLNELTLPTLVIVGENDLDYLLKATDYLEQHLPNGTIVRMEDAAHLPNMDHPQVFQKAVDDFLSKLK